MEFLYTEEREKQYQKKRKTGIIAASLSFALCLAVLGIGLLLAKKAFTVTAILTAVGMIVFAWVGISFLIANVFPISSQLQFIDEMKNETPLTCYVEVSEISDPVTIRKWVGAYEILCHDTAGDHVYYYNELNGAPLFREGDRLSLLVVRESIVGWEKQDEE